MVLDTEAEKILSAKRAGARIVRKAIQKQIEIIRASCVTGDAVGALGDLEEYISNMIARDKKRKGGLWN